LSGLAGAGRLVALTTTAMEFAITVLRIRRTDDSWQPDGSRSFFVCSALCGDAARMREQGSEKRCALD
jgi:hypothetical protein